MKRRNLKRRVKGITDYKRRLALLKSGKPRLVVRKTSNNIIAQAVAYVPAGDKVLYTVDVQALRKKGWKGHANTPAAYLVGYALGKEAKKKTPELVLDAGRHTPSTKIFAVVKGVVDAGIKVPHSQEALPSKDRIRGKHIDAHKKTEVGKNFEKLLKEMG